MDLLLIQGNIYKKTIYHLRPNTGNTLGGLAVQTDHYFHVFLRRCSSISTLFWNCYAVSQERFFISLKMTEIEHFDDYKHYFTVQNKHQWESGAYKGYKSVRKGTKK